MLTELYEIQAITAAIQKQIFNQQYSRTTVDFTCINLLVEKLAQQVSLLEHSALKITKDTKRRQRK